MREILEGIEDDIHAALIILGQFKTFYRVDHRFLEAAFETARFEPEFRRWISILYHYPQAVLQVNGKHSQSFVIERSVQKSSPLSPLLYVLYGSCFGDLQTRGQVQLCTVFSLSVVTGQRSPLTPMISQFLCPASRTQR